jgi:hypothetical protein
LELSISLLKERGANLLLDDLARKECAGATMSFSADSAMGSLAEQQRLMHLKPGRQRYMHNLFSTNRLAVLWRNIWIVEGSYLAVQGF